MLAEYGVVNLIFGAIFIALGLAFLFSRRFGDFAYNVTWQGQIWKRLVGEKAAPYVARYLFSAAGFGMAALSIHAAFYG
jgi:hypothetical protein